jgi:hypothetical protein
MKGIQGITPEIRLLGFQNKKQIPRFLRFYPIHPCKEVQASRFIAVNPLENFVCPAACRGVFHFPLHDSLHIRMRRRTPDFRQV